MTREYRPPVPDGEWAKFSAANEAGVEAERKEIRHEKPTGIERFRTPEARARLDAAMDLSLQKPDTHEQVSQLMEYHTKETPEELLNRVDAGELTYEELDQMVLDGYRETPPSERNWRRDAGFYQLSETERSQELLAEAIRDARTLSETLRALPFSDHAKQRRLRDLLTEIDFELQKEQQ